MLCEQVNRCKHNREGNDIKKETAKENKETRKHLLECAGREFLEKGYMKASLRNICKEAGVTTGALSFCCIGGKTAETTLSDNGGTLCCGDAK